ncbi:hypothetical protein PLESTB_001949100 [Pleodorina starrii]|uniref:ABC transporter domain-containing protein n=1 Tax=Pleodorina starrii TaxID=330485 RepID=A0A9W6FAX3_9CHLO|nr:hypothetical protein PLESTB_001949100 [Pleodorina starrii]
MRFLVLPCDGIGPEITRATMEVLEAANQRFGLGITSDYEDVGFPSLEKYGTTLRDEVIDKARTYDGIVLGPQSHMDYPARDKGGVNVSGGFRVRLDLYANVRPARTRPYLPGKKMDLVIMREATEGFYPDRNMYKGLGEFMPTEDVALSVRKLTSKACERIAREAFKLAMRRGKKVTAVHKANNFIITDGFFLDWVRKVHQDFPEVELNDVIIDAMAAHLDLASELSGSLGLAGSINANAETGLVCAQAQHGSAPDIENQNIANPSSLILSVAMMLTWLGEQRGLPAMVEAGSAIEHAVDAVLENPANRTRDLGGQVNTGAFGALVAAEVAGTALAQDVPAGYPADYAATVEAAKSQGKVVIYTSTDIAQAQALLDAFTAKYGIAVEYNDLGTNGAYNRAISEAAASQMGADIVWSSAMDLQMTLAADGYACNALGCQLSGGQQQRVAICRALVYQPRVLLLDEPLSNLDAKLREEARYWIRKLILDLEICAILVTHDQTEALAAADHILLLQNGRIVQDGTPHDIYSNPRSFYAADFLGANNIARGRVLRAEGANVTIGGEGWELPGQVRDGARLAPDTQAQAVIRVEQIHVTDQPGPDRLEMVLDDSLYLGDRWEYRVRRGDLQIKAHGARELPPGRVYAQIAADKVWVFPAENAA